MPVTDGVTCSAAACAGHAPGEVGGGCNHRLNSARYHTDGREDGLQNGVDTASAIENKPGSKDRKQTSW